MDTRLFTNPLESIRDVLIHLWLIDITVPKRQGTYIWMPSVVRIHILT